MNEILHPDEPIYVCISPPIGDEGYWITAWADDGEFDESDGVYKRVIRTNIHDAVLAERAMVEEFRADGYPVRSDDSCLCGAPMEMESACTCPIDRVKNPGYDFHFGR